MKKAEIERDKEVTRVTLVGSLGNLVLLIFKFVAGLVGHSAAMIADAVHSLSDFITDVVVIVFVKISSKPRDIDHDYGHGKYETFATVIVALALLAVGVGILWGAIKKIIAFASGETLEAPGMIALVAAVLSILIKEALYQYTIRKARQLESPAMTANAWHHRSDAFSSIGTMVGIAGAIFLGVKGRVLDPIAAAVVSLMIIYVAIMLLKPGIDELLERSLPAPVEDKIMQTVEAIEGVHDAHNLRTRRIGSYAAVDMHVCMPGDMTVEASHQITQNIEYEIRKILGSNTIINIHVEPLKHA